MAQVDQALAQQIDGWLDYLEEAWAALPQAEQQIDSWDLIEQIDYVEEWGAKESLLHTLHKYQAQGEMSESQLARLEALERLIERNRAVLERLRAS